MVAGSDLAGETDTRRLTMSSSSSVDLCSSKWFVVCWEVLTPGAEFSRGSSAIFSSFDATDEETRLASASSECALSLTDTVPSVVSATRGVSASMILSSLTSETVLEPF